MLRIYSEICIPNACPIANDASELPPPFEIHIKLKKSNKKKRKKNLSAYRYYDTG